MSTRAAVLPPSFRRLAWPNLAAQSAEQTGLVAAPIVAVLALVGVEDLPHRPARPQRLLDPGAPIKPGTPIKPPGMAPSLLFDPLRLRPVSCGHGDARPSCDRAPRRPGEG